MSNDVTNTKNTIAPSTANPQSQIKLIRIARATNSAISHSHSTTQAYNAGLTFSTPRNTIEIRSSVTGGIA